MGFLCGVMILSLGSEGQTHYVIAGLIVFSLPIMDTLLAILRRKLAGLPMSEPDKNHIHHMFLRGFGGNVKKAVVALYGLNAVFVFVGVSLAATVALGGARYLLAYGTAILIFGFVGAVALKIGLRQRWANQASESSQSDD
jgi:UDP-GlcNAc:undecaprenyl-phosphate GlcNAc-1-phosphate transferase